MSTPEAKELNLLNKVELRIALADSDLKLEAVLKTYLAPLLLKLASEHVSVRNKVWILVGLGVNRSADGRLWCLAIRLSQYVITLIPESSHRRHPGAVPLHGHHFRRFLLTAEP